MTMHHASEILGGQTFRELLNLAAFAGARRRGFLARLQAETRSSNLLRARKARRRDTRLAALEVAGVPRKFWATLLGPLELTAAMNAVGALDERRSLVILSGPGDAGKSTAAALLLMRRGGVWVDAERLLDVWCSGARAGLIEAPALVLDDLARPGGSTDQRAATAEAAEQLLHLRGEGLRPTVVTTNYNRDVLRLFITSGRSNGPTAGERWERLRERLREHGVRPEPGELQRLGGCLDFAGFVSLPYEGLRDPIKRAGVLATKGEVA